MQVFSDDYCVLYITHIEIVHLVQISRAKLITKKKKNENSVFSYSLPVTIPRCADLFDKTICELAELQLYDFHIFEIINVIRRQVISTIIPS